VALKNCEVRVYREKQLMEVLPIIGEVSAMRFGKFGREDNSLIIIDTAGQLTVKVR